LKRKGLDIPDDIMETDTLSRYAWEARSPGLGESITREEYLEAVKMAEAVLTWASSQIA